MCGHLLFIPNQNKPAVGGPSSVCTLFPFLNLFSLFLTFFYFFHVSLVCIYIQVWICLCMRLIRLFLGVVLFPQQPSFKYFFSQKKTKNKTKNKHTTIKYSIFNSPVFVLFLNRKSCASISAKFLGSVLFHVYAT